MNKSITHPKRIFVIAAILAAAGTLCGAEIQSGSVAPGAITPDASVVNNINSNFVYLGELAPLWSRWPVRSGYFMYTRIHQPRYGYSPVPDFIAVDKPVFPGLSKVMKIGNKTYEKGISVPAFTYFAYDLDKKYSLFTADLGGTAAYRGYFQHWTSFEFIGDGKLLYKSPAIFPADPPLRATIPVAGVSNFIIKALSTHEHNAQLFMGAARLYKDKMPGEPLAYYVLDKNEWFIKPVDKIFIYTVDEKMPVNIYGPSNLDENKAIRFEIKIQDTLNKDVNSSNIAVFLPSEKVKSPKYMTYQVPLPRKNGNYEMSMEIYLGNDRIYSDKKHIGIISSRRNCTNSAAASIFGINGVSSLGTKIALKKLGVRWFRLWAVWGNIETEDGVFEFDLIDDHVQETLDNGMLIHADLMSGHCYPVWLEKLEIVDKSGDTYKWERQNKGFTPPVDKTVRFVRQVVKRYKNKIKVYELINEPWNREFGRDKIAPVLEALLQAVYPVIKEEDPEAKLIQGHFYVTCKRLLDDGASKYLDGITVHPYRRVAPETKAHDPCADPNHGAVDYEQIIADNQALIKEYPHMEFWINETGFFEQDMPLWTQANYMARTYLLSLCQKTPVKIFKHNEMNFFTCGGKEHPGAPFLLALVFAELSNRLEGSVFDGYLFRTDDVRVPVYKRGDKKITVLWRTDENERDLLIGGNLDDAEIVDLMGVPIDVALKNGLGILKVGPGPIYIEQNSGDELVVKKSPLDMNFTVENIIKGNDAGFNVEIANPFSNTISGKIKCESSPGGFISPENVDYTLAPYETKKYACLCKIPVESGDSLIKLKASTVLNGLECGIDKEMPLIDSFVILPCSIRKISAGRERVNLMIKNQTDSPQEITVICSSLNNNKIPISTNELSIKPLQTTWVEFDVDSLMDNARILFEILRSGKKMRSYEFNYYDILCRHVKTPMAVDGDLGDWNETYIIDNKNEIVELMVDKPCQWRGADDLSAQLYSAWNASGLFLAARVRDDVHKTMEPIDKFYQGDSIQIAIDPTGKAETYGEIHEFGFAPYLKGGLVYITQVSKAADPKAKKTAKPVEFKFKRKDDITVYEMFIPWGHLSPLNPENNRNMRISFLINDNDGSGRGRWLESFGGIGKAKNPSLYGRVYLSD